MSFLKSLFTLEGKNAVVTGAGSGLGLQGRVRFRDRPVHPVQRRDLQPQRAAGHGGQLAACQGGEIGRAGFASTNGVTTTVLFVS